MARKGASRLDRALGQIPAAAVAESKHVIWGKPELDREAGSSEPCSASWSSVLRGIHLEDQSHSSTEPSGSFSSNQIPNPQPSQGQQRLAGRQRPTDSVPSRPLQSWGDMPVDMDSEACSDAALSDADSNDGEAADTAGGPAIVQSRRGDFPCYDQELHDSGKCRPCSYFVKKGCKGGDSCTFCHLAHTPKARPCKQKREKCKMQMDTAAREHAPTARMKEIADKDTLHGRYMRDLIQIREKGDRRQPQ